MSQNVEALLGAALCQEPSRHRFGDDPEFSTWPSVVRNDQQWALVVDGEDFSRETETQTRRLLMEARLFPVSQILLLET